MDLPPGFNGDDKGDKVCRLKRSLNGLKLSARAWFDRFTKAIHKQGYHQAQADHTLFQKHKNGKITVLIVYVDDIILTTDDKEEMEKVKKGLASKFEMITMAHMTEREVSSATQAYDKV